MFVASHSLPVITESVSAGVNAAIIDWLKGLDASPSTRVMVTYNQPPMLSTQNAHGFVCGKKINGWVDILESDDKVVQVVLSVCYPKQRWFSRHKKDWNKLIAQAGEQFGVGKTFDLAEKQGRLYKHNNLSVLLSSFTKGKQSTIEIKIARGGFCS